MNIFCMVCMTSRRVIMVEAHVSVRQAVLMSEPASAVPRAPLINTVPKRKKGKERRKKKKSRLG